MKPAIFVASSVEGLPIARAIQLELEHDADTTLWNQGIFSPGGVTLDSLLERTVQFDFAAFVLSHDDLLKMRQQEFVVARDNVLFEFGTFVSKLGRRQSFIITPRNALSPLHLPTDLAGLVAIEYDAERLERDEPQAVLGAACQRNRAAMTSEWPSLTNLTPDLVLLLRYLYRDSQLWLLSGQYSQSMAMARGAPEAADEHLKRGWRRAVRYQMLLLHHEGLVDRRTDTSVTYTISKKGKRWLNSPRIRDVFREVFAQELRPLSGRDW